MKHVRTLLLIAIAAASGCSGNGNAAPGGGEGGDGGSGGSGGGRGGAGGGRATGGTGAGGSDVGAGGSDVGGATGGTSSGGTTGGGGGITGGGGVMCTMPPPAGGASGGPSPARPRPFLKPRASATAHQWIDMFTEAEWVALVPHQSPRVPTWGGCHPAGSTDYKWDPKDPDHLTFVDAAGMPVVTLPGASDVRTNVSVTVLSGKTVTVPVWTVNGATCYLQETIDYEKSQFLFDRLENLAAGYAATKDEAFARRIALALEEWSKYLPDYFMTNENNGKPIDVATAEAKKYTVVQRMSDHNGVGHELDRGVVMGLDAIYDSQALKDLSAQRGYDVRKKIVDDFFGNHVDFLLNKIPIETHVATNLSGTPEQLANLAIVLQRSDWIEWLNRYMQLTVVHLLRDGMDGESFSYCSGYLGANRATTVNMTAYFDVWPPASAAQQAIDAAAARYNAMIQRGLDAITSVLLPDGTVPPFGNTSFNGGGKARTQSHSVLLPAYGHLTLGDGTGADQVQVNLNFVDNANHDEQDVLTFTLFGAQNELIGDIRYSRMPGRPFTESSMAHNVVVVNRKDQFRSTNQDTGNRGHLFTGGDLLTFEPNLAGVSLAEVDGHRAYLQTADRYQRLQILNAVDPAHPYVVDLFRARGGTTHDYFIHGASRFDETAPPPEKTKPAGASTLPLALIDKPYPLLEGTETFVEPVQDNEPWYGAFRDVWSARSNGNWSVTFQAVTGGQGTRISMVDDGNVDVFVSKSPNPFRDKMPAETPQAFYGFWRPSLMVRHTGAPADTLYAAVIEPFATAPAIASIERLALDKKDLDHVGLRVRFTDGREDVVLVDLANPVVTGQPAAGMFGTSDGKLALVGRAAVLSRRGTANERATLVAGTRFVHDGKMLTAERGAWSGAVTTVSSAGATCGDNAFVVDAALPEGNALKGRYLTVTFGSYAVVPSGTSYPLGIMEEKGIRQPYRIDHVERRAGKTWVLLADDPMVVQQGGAFVETTRPGRTFTGPATFEITLGAAQ